MPSPKKTTKAAAAPTDEKKGGSSSTSPTKAAASAAPDLDLVAQDTGGAAHHLQFRSPVYVSAWLDDRHCVIGGGGGSRFGMTNGLAILSVAPSAATAGRGKGDSPSSSEDKTDEPPLWQQVGSVNLKQNILWCLSNVERFADATAPKSGGTPCERVFMCVSHLDSFSVIEGRGIRSADATPEPGRILGAPKLRKVCRVALVTDDIEDGEPEKKPVAIAGGLVFAAQDNNTIAVFRLSTLTTEGEGASPSKRPAAKPTEDATKKESSDANDSFTAFGSENPSDVAATIDLGGRVNDIAARRCPWDERKVFVVALCKDKSVYQIEVDPASCEVKAKSKLSGATLGFGDKPLTRSAFRLVTSFNQQLPVTDTLAAKQRGVGSGFDADEEPATKDGETADKSKPKAAGERQKRVAPINAVFLVLSHVDGATYAQRIILKSDGRRAIELPVKIGGEVPTAVSYCRVAGSARFTNIFVATADGGLVELQDSAAKALRLRRQRKALHIEPISCVAAHANGGFVSADIAQRVVLSNWGAVKSLPRLPEMALFPAQGGLLKSAAPILGVLVLLVALLAFLVQARLLPDVFAWA